MTAQEVVKRALWAAQDQRLGYAGTSQHILAALDAAGLAVVPREPTEDMVNQGTIVALEHRLERRHRSKYSGSNAGEVYAAYRAMLEAAQEGQR